MPVTSLGQNSEDEIKAAFLYNFAKFIDWPTHVSPDSGPFMIGIVGDEVLFETLSKLITGRTVKGREVGILNLQTVPENRVCQILFINQSGVSGWPEQIERLKGLSILTVGEGDRFLDDGGIISWKLESRKLRIEINLSSARAEGLVFSSKLLKIAFKVHEG